MLSSVLMNAIDAILTNGLFQCSISWGGCGRSGDGGEDTTRLALELTINLLLLVLNVFGLFVWVIFNLGHISIEIHWLWCQHTDTENCTEGDTRGLRDTPRLLLTVKLFQQFKGSFWLCSTSWRMFVTVGIFLLLAGEGLFGFGAFRTHKNDTHSEHTEAE